MTEKLSGNLGAKKYPEIPWFLLAENHSFPESFLSRICKNHVFPESFSVRFSYARNFRETFFAVWHRICQNEQNGAHMHPTQQKTCAPGAAAPALQVQQVGIPYLITKLSATYGKLSANPAPRLAVVLRRRCVCFPPARCSCACEPVRFAYRLPPCVLP